MDFFTSVSSQRFLTALIVDCCGQTRTVCRAAFERVGYQVYQTVDTSLAIKLLAQKRFDFLVLDLKTVFNQGYTIPEVVNSSCVDLRVAFLTTHPALVPKNLTTRANHIIYKPINPTQLITHAVRLKDTLARRES